MLVYERRIVMKKNNIFVKSIIYILVLCGLFQSMAAAVFAEKYRYRGR